MPIRVRVPLSIAGLALFAQTVAGATIATKASFTVGATVANGCLVSAAPEQTVGVVFGQFSFAGVSALSASDQTVALGASTVLRCTTGADVRLTLDGGQHFDGLLRRMSDGRSFMPYRVTLTTAGNAPVLPGIPVTIPIGATPQPLPLRASLLLSGSGLPAGTYTDTVQVTVSW
ncbi:fimbrial major subunit CsuA/B family protein [Xylophilus sp. Kf1]|nr:fimbrial major subunit CsuA/B family protein [Xylophilus sp. Kf1]